VPYFLYRFTQRLGEQGSAIAVMLQQIKCHALR
jgi:hypothetical protein